MDINQPLDNDFSNQFGITTEIRAYLQETYKWANFLAILGFIGLGLMVIAGLFMGVAFGAMAGDMPTTAMPFNPMIISVFYIAIAAVMFFPVLYLYRFAQNMKTALRSDDQGALTASFMNLKSSFKFYGIITIVMLGLYVLAIIGAMIAGVMM